MEWKENMFYVIVIKGFNQPRAPGNEVTISAEKMMPDANLLAERKLLGNMESIKSLKQSGLSGVFTGQAVSAGHFARPPSGSAPFLRVTCRVCTEQDGGPPHRRGQPVGHRLPGAHSRRERPSHCRVEETSHGETAAGQAAGWRGSEEEGNGSPQGFVISGQQAEHRLVNCLYLWTTPNNALNLAWLQCHPHSRSAVILVWKTSNVNLSPAETCLINQGNCLHDDVTSHRWKTKSWRMHTFLN